MSDPSPARPPTQFVVSSVQMGIAALGLIVTLATGYAAILSRLAVTEVLAAPVAEMGRVVNAHEARIQAVEDALIRGRAERIEFQRDMIHRLDRIAESLAKKEEP